MGSHQAYGDMCGKYLHQFQSHFWNAATNLPMVFHDANFDKYSLKNGGDGVHSAPIPDAYNYWAGAQDDTVS